MSDGSGGGLIAVTGATGQVGGRVAARLAARGLEQRLIVRDAARAPALAGAEVAEALSYAATSQMRTALTGADTLFLVSGRESPGRVAGHRSAVDAAVAAGIERIVYLSFLGAGPRATFTLAREHWATEQHIRVSGLVFTFLRQSIYLDFMPFLAGADGVIRGPGGTGRLAPVARDDVADVAVAALTDPAHAGPAYDLTGGERLTLEQVAAELSRAAGRTVTYVDETLEEAYASRAHFGAPPREVDGWVTSYAAIAAGELDVVSDTVERVAGHAPLTLPEYLERYPESWAHLRPSGD